MIRLLALAAALLAALPAQAADRTYGVGSFDRVRVEGPFEVSVATGSPGARASGDQRVIDRLEIAVNGTTLVVRLGNGGWGETPSGKTGAPPVVTLSTPRLSGASLSAGARLRIAEMRGPRVDVAVTGAGTLDLAEADADQLNATLVGPGQINIAGKARRALLLANGPGVLDAGGLATNDLTVRLEGTGEVKAAARYTAQVTSTGLGRVTVAGDAKCIVKAVSDGPVSCGTGGAKR